MPQHFLPLTACSLSEKPGQEERDKRRGKGAKENQEEVEEKERECVKETEKESKDTAKEWMMKEQEGE